MQDFIEQLQSLDYGKFDQLRKEFFESLDKHECNFLESVICIELFRKSLYLSCSEALAEHENMSIDKAKEQVDALITTINSLLIKSDETEESAKETPSEAEGVGQLSTES